MNNPTDEIKEEIVSSSKALKSRFASLKKINPKVLLAIVIVLALISLAYIARGLFVAATVDGSPISRLSVIQRLERSSGSDVVDALISKKLIEMEARKNKIEISDKEIDAEVAKIEETVTASGGTLDEALKAEKLTMSELKEQIVVQKLAEALLAEKTKVEDAEIDAQIAKTGTSAPAGQEAEYREQVREQLESQKLSQEFSLLIDRLRKEAKIKYYVNY
jgi:hypothetical protein